jgi:hypothetical protein
MAKKSHHSKETYIELPLEMQEVEDLATWLCKAI